MIVSVPEELPEFGHIVYPVTVHPGLSVPVHPFGIDEDRTIVPDLCTVSVLLRDLDEFVSESRAHFVILSMVGAGDIDTPAVGSVDGDGGEQSSESESVAIDATPDLILPPVGKAEILEATDSRSERVKVPGVDCGRHGGYPIRKGGGSQVPPPPPRID